MRHILTTIAAIMISASAALAQHTVADVPNVHRADRTRYVSNPDGVLSEPAVARLDSLLASVWATTSAEIVVVAVDGVEGGDPDTFATELFEQWGIGKSDKDNGLLFLLSTGDRKAVIRTGYGMEGVVPDILAGRIIRAAAAADFSRGDWDAGTMAAISEIARLTTTPGATEELMSKFENDRDARPFSIDSDEVFAIWLNLGFALAAGMLIWFIATMLRTRRLDRHERYRALHAMLVPGAIIGFAGLGIPLAVLALAYIVMRRTRLKTRICPNCHSAMRRLDEETDNKYLTPAQDAEERIRSVDYDVWLCPTCGETDVLPYVNIAAPFSNCPVCGARACTLQGKRVIMPPTEHREGRGEQQYVCHNCHHVTRIPYTIAKLAPVVPIIIGGGGFGSGGGGGFSGGSFGGGSTGGGGASGGW